MKIPDFYNYRTCQHTGALMSLTGIIRCRACGKEWSDKTAKLL